MYFLRACFCKAYDRVLSNTTQEVCDRARNRAQLLCISVCATYIQPKDYLGLHSWVTVKFYGLGHIGDQTKEHYESLCKTKLVNLICKSRHKMRIGLTLVNRWPCCAAESGCEVAKFLSALLMLSRFGGFNVHADNKLHESVHDLIVTKGLCQVVTGLNGCCL